MTNAERVDRPVELHAGVLFTDGGPVSQANLRVSVAPNKTRERHRERR